VSTAAVSTTPSLDGITTWKKGDSIGTGSYGCVFKARNASNGALFVVKENIVDDQVYHEKLQQELEICKDLDHKHIVKCLGHEYADRHLYIFFEYVAGGSLQCALTEFGPLEQGLMRTAMHALLEGLEYLHTRSPPVVHRDIKSANILISADFCVKLADFGCSKCNDLTTSFTTVGSVLWMAPEVIRCDNGGFGRKADIWSLGCVFIEMATAERPWKGHAFDNVWQAMKHIEGSDERPNLPDGLPEIMRSVIVRCVERCPSQRAGASELLAHKLFQADST
jgi:serine/threonine protein kinase